jgi:hypothetical protein
VCEKVSDESKDMVHTFSNTRELDYSSLEIEIDFCSTDNCWPLNKRKDMYVLRNNYSLIIHVHLRDLRLLSSSQTYFINNLCELLNTRAAEE